VKEFGALGKRFGAEPLSINPDATKIPDRRWCERSERWTVERACAKAGVDCIPPNDLCRHHFATTIVDAGGDMYALKEWMGHAHISTTERFTHVAPQRLGRPSRIRGRQIGPTVDHAQTTEEKDEEFP